MVPIRKGDGTTVMPDGIGQVRTGDGRVFFEGDAIPDSGVWQREESSREFWEENGQLWFYPVDGDLDILISSNFGSGNGTENLFGLRDQWSLITDDIDVDQTFSQGVKEWLWFVDNDRYVHEQRKIPNTDAVQDTAIIILGPWDVSSADKIFYDLDLAGDSSSTVGLSLSLADPGTNDENNVDVIAEIEYQESEDSFADISNLDGDKEVVIMSNSGSSDAEFNNRSVNVFFE